MRTAQVLQILTSLAVILALGDAPQPDSADRRYTSGSLLAAEAFPELQSAAQEVDENRDFRAAMAAHHICSGL